jgi:hypothetical protein
VDLCSLRNQCTDCIRRDRPIDPGSLQGRGEDAAARAHLAEAPAEMNLNDDIRSFPLHSPASFIHSAESLTAEANMYDTSVALRNTQARRPDGPRWS